MRNRVLTAALLVALSAPAFAQDDEEASSPFSFSVGVVSDYVFRGVSQTNQGPAWQASAEFEHSSGWYLGTWASRVDYEPGDGANAEVDLYIGWRRQVNDLLHVDVSFLRYEYLTQNDYEYYEWLFRVGVGDYVGLELGYSNDVFNSSETGIYYGLSAAYPIEWGELTLQGGLGRYDLEDVYGTGYNHAYIGFAKEFGPMEVSVAHHHASSAIDWGRNGGNRLALSAIWSF